MFFRLRGSKLTSTLEPDLDNANGGRKNNKAFFGKYLRYFPFVFVFPVQTKEDVDLVNKKTSVLGSGLLWFGAAVSIAEIMTGALIAPLGLAKGVSAILLGHVIGCMLLYFAGLIGAKTGRSAMETVKISFGQKGSLLFSILNVLQLVGWTAVMILSGANASGVILLEGKEWIWSLIIGALIILWIFIGSKNLNKLNYFAMGGLFILTLILSAIVFRGNPSGIVKGDMSFGAAVELSAAMPISWLPLISDYTSNAEKPKTATTASTVAYFITSSWMYIIGMGAAIFTGESDIAKTMVSAGFAVAGIIIIIFSSITTIYLDVYSAGVSASSISKKFNKKYTAVAVCIIGLLLAVFTPVEKLEDFLYLIGSVFAPMIAIQITDSFILKKDYTDKKYNVMNLILWAVGFAVYRILMSVSTPVGITLPVMIIIIALCIITNKIRGVKFNVK